MPIVKRFWRLAVGLAFLHFSKCAPHRIMFDTHDPTAFGKTPVVVVCFVSFCLFVCLFSA